MKAMEPARQRGAAITALAKWMRTRVFPDRLLADGHAQAMEMAYGAIRHLRALDTALAPFCRRNPGPLPRAALLIGAWQLLVARGIPDYAAISETVAAAKTVHAGSPGFVNAVLRNVARSRETILAQLAAAPLAVRASHPDELVRRWLDAFGAEAAAAICEADNLEPSATAVPLPFSDASKADALEARWRRAGIETVRLGAALAVPHGLRIETLPGFAEGAFAIQDPATLLPLRLLDPQPGETILDACAAPGGKALQAAAAVGACGRTLAFDQSAARLGRLRENAARAGLLPAMAIDVQDAASPALAATVEGHLSGRRLDAAIVDVPCSNSGVFRRRPDARWRWSAEETDRLAARQFAILANVAALRAPRLVYSTCSIDPAEDEAVVARFLASAGGSYALGAERKLLPTPERDGAYAALLVAR